MKAKLRRRRKRAGRKRSRVTRRIDRYLKAWFQSDLRAEILADTTALGQWV